MVVERVDAGAVGLLGGLEVADDSARIAEVAGLSDCG
jgi:hypothetical protein